MSWVAVGIAGVSLLMTMQANKENQKAAKKQEEGILAAGAQRQAAANREADYLEINATQKVAVGQQQMFDAQRVTRLTNSRVQALAAASGGGATSPGVLTVMGQISKVGALNASRELYSGEEAARNMRLQAIETRRTGDFESAAAANQAEVVAAGAKAGEYKAIASGLGTAGSLYGKYGGRRPTSTADTGGSGTYFNFNSDAGIASSATA